MNKRICARIIAVIMTVFVLCTILATAVNAEEAEDTGSVMFSVNASAQGAGVMLQPIGSITDGIIVFDEAYSWIDVDKLLEGDADYLYETAAQAEDQARESSASDGRFERLDLEGVAVWDNVPLDKVYLAYQVDGFRAAIFQSSIFTCPMIIDDELIKDVVVQSKFVTMGEKYFQGSVILNKLGYENRRLEGAQFTLWEKVYYNEDESLPVDAETGTDGDITFYWSQLGGTMTTNEHGQIMVEGLPFGSYRFVETKAPDGYLTDSRSYVFDVYAMSTVKVENELYVAEEGEPVVLNIENMIDPENPPPYYIQGQGEISEPTPEPSPADIVIPDDDKPQITSDDMKKYVIIGAIVGLSLALIIILFLIGGKRGSKDKENK